MNHEVTLTRMLEWYGDGSYGTAPTVDQWARILNRDPDDPFALVNFFKFRDVANYGEGKGEVSGAQAFDRYASVSIPTMEKVGGTFLLVSAFQSSLIGADEDWDLVAIGAYPDLNTFLGLYQDADYCAAFRHRTAACLRQKVLVAEM